MGFISGQFNVRAPLTLMQYWAIVINFYVEKLGRVTVSEPENWNSGSRLGLHTPEREKEKERNINHLPLTHPQLGTWPATQACVLTLTGN